MTEKRKKVRILRAYGEPTHFTRKQIEAAVKKVREDRLRREKAEQRIYGR